MLETIGIVRTCRGPYQETSISCSGLAEIPFLRGIEATATVGARVAIMAGISTSKNSVGREYGVRPLLGNARCL